MWKVKYTLAPDQGYFDRGEQVFLDADVILTSILSMEFLTDGSVVFVYEVEASVDALTECLDGADKKVVEYSITADSEPLVLQVRFHPDDSLQRILWTQQSFGVSIEFPIRYVEHGPEIVEIVEYGPRKELRSRINETRKLATVHVKKIHRYAPSTGTLFQELSTRQQEVLIAAVEMGYYRNPRESTHDDIAENLGCSSSVVGQHLRGIERRLVAAAVPESVDAETGSADVA